MTAESKKNYIKKNCVVDKHRRMAGSVEISCKKGAENGGIVESFWNEIIIVERTSRQKLIVKKRVKGVEQLGLNTPGARSRLPGGTKN